MPVRIEVRLSDDGAGAALEALAQRTRDLSRPLDEIGAELTASAQDRIADAEGPDGRPWPPLSPATRARRGAGARPLRDRGHLMDSLTWRAGTAQVAVGSNRKYARIQQLGGQAGRGLKVTIPARPFLGVSAADRETIAEIVAAHLKEL